MTRQLPPNMTFKKSRGTYHLVQTVKGKRKWTSLGKSYNEAMFKYGELMPSSSKIEGTFRELVAEYIKDDQYTDLSTVTKKQYLSHINFLLASFGDAKVNDIKPRDLYLYMKARTSKNSARSEHSIMSKILGLGIILEYNEINIAKMVPYYKQGKGRKTIITPEDWEAMIEASKGNLIPIFMDLAVCLGIRVGDILSLRWDQVTDEGILIHQRKNDVNGFYKMTPALREVLNRAKRLHNTKRFPQPHTRIIHRRDGKPYTYRGFEQQWRVTRLRANCRHINIHDIRRNAITLASKGGIAPEVFSLHGSAKQAAHYDQNVPVVTVNDPAIMRLQSGRQA